MTKNYLLVVLINILLMGCGSLAKEYDSNTLQTSSNTFQATSDTRLTPSSDNDEDYIPNAIEEYIGSDMYNGDTNHNGILDGLETRGEFGDNYFSKQWYIYSSGSLTNGSGVSSLLGYNLNLLPVYQKYMGYNGGNNIVIQIVDTGVYYLHEDLYDNIDTERSHNGLKFGRITLPSTSQPHGTKVAGVIAARGFNGKGVRGIIPFGKIAVSDWLMYSSLEILEEVWLTGYKANDIAISNNSWGFEFSTQTIPEEYMQRASSQLREGKGRLFVFPAGNLRNIKGSANLQYILNNRFAITVASVNYNNKHSSYSSKGSNILIAAYSGEDIGTTPTIATTTVPQSSNNSSSNPTTWHDDYERNYTFDFSGTSAATPMVSASIGLVLEACPTLTWRDVRHLLALTSKQIDSTNSSWIKNGAGLYHSIDYGFGLINPAKMIEVCQTHYDLLPAEDSFQKTIYPNTPIADNLSTTLLTIDVLRSLTIEWVELTIDSDHRYASDLAIYLVSPSGTKTQLLDQNTISSKASTLETTADWMNGGFRLSSAAFVDEISKGEWQVEIVDKSMGDSGTVNTLKLKIYGH
ncbi:MAG: hypothetical protein KU38_08275 [Sulfurovum sp. FS08-3]|nr:MAG: hypothetical protein KU38_08275 [Sulfurovum sp. FS08-3]